MTEGAPAIWSRVAWAGSIMSPAAGTAAGAFIVAVALLGDAASAEVAALGLAGNFYAFVVSGALSGFVMIAVAMVILRTGVFWRWLGWAGVFLGLMALAGSAALVENDPSGLLAAVSSLTRLAYFAWIAILSVALMRVPAEASMQ